MLKTQIKASQITNLTDARYFAAWGVNWLGFQLDPSAENYISPQTVLAIKGWVEGPELIGRFGNIGIENIKHGIDLLGLNGIEIDMFDNRTDLKTVLNTTVIQEVIIEKKSKASSLEKLLQDRKNYVDFFQLDFDEGGLTWENLEEASELSITWLSHVCRNFPVILNMSVKSENLVNMLEKTQPKGLSFKGGEEEKVGFKSFDEIDQLFEILEAEED